MEIFLIWIVVAILVGLLGRSRKIGFGMAFVWSLILSPIIGLIIVLLSKDKESVEAKHKFVYYAELAKKAEFKGQYVQAIDYYMDTLYHLENDYKHVDKKSEEGRQRKINSTKKKIEDLKQKVSKVPNKDNQEN